MRIDTTSADVEVVGGHANKVKAALDGGTGGVQLVQQGDRVDVVFDHPGGGCDGRVRAELPPGSSVEVQTASGDIVVQDVNGRVRLRSTSGEVHVRRATDVEVRTISGDLALDEITGEARLRTVSGDARITQDGAGRLEYGTTSGDLDWTGACGAHCRLEARTTSGDIVLHLAPSSSFDLRYLSHSGELCDQVGVKIADAMPNRHGGGMTHATLGSGEGVIECQTFSGDLQLKKR
jgi:DUF4097 and DUF4098 domain-containing protein YvlB